MIDARGVGSPVWPARVQWSTTRARPFFLRIDGLDVVYDDVILLLDLDAPAPMLTTSSSTPYSTGTSKIPSRRRQQPRQPPRR